MGLVDYLLIALAVAVASATDAVSAIWAQDKRLTSIWFFVVLALSPVVFISFGIVTAKIGVSVTSGIINSLLVVSTIAVGLIFFGEWDDLSFYQYLGLIFAIVGIVLMLFFPKP